MSDYNDEQGFAWDFTFDGQLKLREWAGGSEAKCLACGDSGVRQVNDHGLVADITCECQE